MEARAENIGLPNSNDVPSLSVKLRLGLIKGSSSTGQSRHNFNICKLNVPGNVLINGPGWCDNSVCDLGFSFLDACYIWQQSLDDGGPDEDCPEWESGSIKMKPISLV
jgi:hypothetical protein